MKIFLAILGLHVLLPLVIAAGTWRIPIHNAKLHSFREHFDMLTHPEHSRLLAKVQEFGNFGESNHCDYLVGDFRVSPLEKSQILEDYAEMTIPLPDGRQHGWNDVNRTASAVEVLFADSSAFAWHPWSDWLSQVTNQLRPGETTYFVFASEDGYPASGDLRCH